MAIFDSCGCCSLRTGSILVGCFLTVFSSLVSAGMILMLLMEDLGAFLEEIWQQAYFLGADSSSSGLNSTAGPLPLEITPSQVLGFEFCLVVGAVLMCSSVLSNILLIGGAIKLMPSLLVQWLAIQWVLLLSVVAGLGLMLWRLIASGFVHRYWWALVFGIGILILLLLALLLVLSFHQWLRERELPDVGEDIELMNRQLWMPKDYNSYN